MSARNEKDVSKEEELASQLVILTDAAKNIIYPKPSFDDIVDANQRKALEYLLGALVSTVQAVFELHSVYGDLVVIRKMARRYPWRPVHIKKSEHLKVVWFQHINLCYLFEEKVKLVRTQCRYLGRVCKIVVGHDFNDAHLRSIQSKVKTSLGDHIRARGQTFHEWYQDHEHLRTYSAVELAHRFSPEKFIGIKQIYSMVRTEICDEIDETLEFMHQFISEIAKQDLKHIIECVQQFNAIWKMCRETPANIDLRLAEVAA